MTADLQALVAARGGTAKVAKAVGTDPYELAQVLMGEEESWPRLRRLLAAYLDRERAELFPEWADYDAAYEAGRARRGDRRLSPEQAALAASLFADARRPT